MKIPNYLCVYIQSVSTVRLGIKRSNPLSGSNYLLWVHTPHPSWHAENQGMDGLAEIKQKFKRLLMYVSRKSTSGVLYSLFFSQYYLPKFSGFESLFLAIHFPQHEHILFQQLRDTVFILALHTPERKPSMLWRAAVNHFKWLFEWEIMENATLIFSPHPCNSEEHCIGGISVLLHWVAQYKEHRFIFKLGSTWEEYPRQWAKTVHEP